MKRESSKVGPKKCKAPRGPRTAATTPGVAPWLLELIADAMTSCDLLGACKRAKIGLFELHRIRQRNPEADAALAEVDELLTLAAIEQVRASAAAGDLRAVRALTDGTLARLLPAAEQVRAHRWRAWTNCPGCHHHQIYAIGWTTAGAGLTVHLYTPESKTGREHLTGADDATRAWIAALDGGEPWAISVITKRDNPCSALDLTSPKTTTGPTASSPPG